MGIRSLIQSILLLIIFSLSSFSLPTLTYSLIQEEEQDTVVVADTLDEPIRVLIIPGLGSLQDRSITSLSYLDHLWLEYMSSIDNLAHFPGIYIRDKGAVGQPHEVTAYGMGWRSIGAMIDGRPANDPMTGVYDFNLFATEYIQKIEYLPPSRSFLYQRNAVGSLYNFVTQSYIAPSPYTKIRYSEGPNNYSQTDVVLSQDIAAGLNLTAGGQRHFFGRADPGQRFSGRFPNMNYRNLHYRSKLRWNLKELLNVAAAYSYTNTNTGLSGGIDIYSTPEEDIYNEREATMRSLRAFQRIKRHDLTISAAAQLLPDSLDTTNLTFYYSNHLRQYREQDRIARADTIYSNDYRTLMSGVDFKQWFTIGHVRFHAGATYIDNHITVSDKTGKLNEKELGTFFRSIFDPIPQLTANIMIRSDWFRSANFTSYGADLTLTAGTIMSITGGGVHTYRHPTLQELYWQDTTVIRPVFLVPEIHDMLFAEIHLYPLRSLHLTFGGLYLSTTDPIIYEQGEISRSFPDITIRQSKEARALTGYTRAQFSIGKFTLKTLINIYRIEEDSVRRKYLPNIDINTALQYRSLLFNGALDLQVKLEALYIGEQFGMDFDPETYFSSRQSFAQIGPSGLLNGSIIGKIGSAYVHITYRNITGTDYMKTPFYPMYSSNLRFGITWEFLN
jgi:hypothetical protein